MFDFRAAEIVVRCNILDSLSSVDSVGDGRGGYALNSRNLRPAGFGLQWSL